MFLMMMPTIAAAEPKVVQTAKRHLIFSVTQALISKHFEKNRSMIHHANFYHLTSTILLLKLLRWGSLLLIGGIIFIIMKKLGR
jgi:hypothetical protein